MLWTLEFWLELEKHSTPSAIDSNRQTPRLRHNRTGMTQEWCTNYIFGGHQRVAYNGSCLQWPYLLSRTAVLWCTPRIHTWSLTVLTKLQRPGFYTVEVWDNQIHRRHCHLLLPQGPENHPAGVYWWAWNATKWLEINELIVNTKKVKLKSWSSV